MELVSVSKVRKAKDSMNSAQLYLRYSKNIVSNVLKTNASHKHPYFQIRENIRQVGIIVISTDRGLCGGLNINLFKKVIDRISFYKSKGFDVSICLVGSKAEIFFKRLKGINIVSVINSCNGELELSKVISSFYVLLELFNNTKISKIFVFYNKFISMLQQKPVDIQLLPIIYDKPKKPANFWDYIYEPDSDDVLDILLVRYVESQLYCAVVENAACEQTARMLAMKNASSNASDMIDSLRLKYNKVRQAMITQELAEIISGSDALGSH